MRAREAGAALPGAPTWPRLGGGRGGNHVGAAGDVMGALDDVSGRGRVDS